MKTGGHATAEAAQEAAEAALARLLAEDEGLRAILDIDEVDQCNDALREARECVRDALGADRPFLDDGIRAITAQRDAALARVAELEAAARWIPVGESLPDERCEVLVWDGRDSGEAFLSFGSWWPAEGSSIDGVTHWRPLPAGPEVEK